MQLLAAGQRVYDALDLDLGARQKDRARALPSGASVITGAAGRMRQSGCAIQRRVEDAFYSKDGHLVLGVSFETPLGVLRIPGCDDGHEGP